MDTLREIEGKVQQHGGGVGDHPRAPRPAQGNLPLDEHGRPYEDRGNATIVYCESLDDARAAAADDILNIGGRILEAVLFHQGARPMLVTAMPFPQVTFSLKARSAAAASTSEDVDDATNRPKDRAHVDAIRNYIVENYDDAFILPALTVNMNRATMVYTVQSKNARQQPPTRLAYIPLEMNPVLSITDGQHRQQAIADAYKELIEDQDSDWQVKLSRSSVPVTIVLEDRKQQVHQDFADASKGRPMPPSLLAIYDRRHPANGLVMDLIDKCALFRGKTDATSVKLTKDSRGVFLTNMIRQAVKTFMTGGYGIGEHDFEVRAKKDLGTNRTEAYRELSDFVVKYVDLITDAIPRLREYADLSPEDVRRRMPELRASGYLCLTSTGLAILSRVGWAIREDGVEGWEQNVARLSEIDWHRGNPEWNRLGIATEKRVSTGHASVIAGAAYVADVIGLQLPSLKKAIPISAGGGDGAGEQEDELVTA
jgi:DNA sulfur modification protein DndB